MRKYLEELINLSQTPTTGRKVACIIRDSLGRIYSGYNIESEDKIIHAEENALSCEPPFLIDSMHLIGNSNDFSDVKHIIPCENCCKLLSPFAKQDSEVIFYTHNPDLEFGLNLGEIISSYEPHATFKKLQDNNVKDFIKQNTSLTPIDTILVENIFNELKRHHNKNNVHFYITGSSVKDCGPTSLLANKISGVPYLDIDMIFIFPDTCPADVNSSIKGIYSSALSSLRWNNRLVFDKDMPPYILELREGNINNDSFLFRKVYWTQGMQLGNSQICTKDIKLPSTIDVSVGKSLQGTITKRYIDKNWYIQLL